MSDGITTILPEDDMRWHGFTDHRAGFWYRVIRVGSGETLNITVNKLTGEYEELVMDEDFGQPAYYGRMKPVYRDAIRLAVDEQVCLLNAAGMTIAVDHRLYGCETLAINEVTK